MTDLAKLVVKLEAQTGKFQKDLDRANKKVDRFGKRTKKSLKGVQGLFAGLAIGALTKKIIDATAKQEQAFAQLEQGIKSTNQAVGYSAKELANYAGQLQAATTFGDEDIIAAQSQLITFTKITGDEFQKTTELALDMSARFGTDVKSSVLQLGKALNDPVANLSALSRAGIQFSKDQKDMIKSLIESGDQVSAQKIILQELETQFGGSARAARDTFGGALQALGNSFGDLLEGGSGLNEAKGSIEELTTLLSDPKTIEAANKLTSTLIVGFSKLIEVMAKVPDFATWLGESAAAAVGGAGDVVRLNEELAGLGARFEWLSGQLRSAKAEYNENGDTWFGVSEEDIQRIAERLNTVVEEYAKTEAKIKAITKISTPLTPPPETSVSEADIPAPGIQQYSMSGSDSLAEDDLFTEINAEVDAAIARVDSIVSETMPKIEQVKIKIAETISLFSQGLMGEDVYQQAMAFYGTQLSEIENKDIEAFENKIARMEEQFLTEYDLLDAQKVERMAMLDDKLAKERMTEEQIAALKLKINEKYIKDKSALDKAASQAEMRTALTVAHGVLGIMSAFAGRSVKAQKALAIAEGIINITAGITKALNNPYPANLGFAANVAAQGAALLSTIKGTNLGSSSNIPTGSTGATSSNYATPSAAAPVDVPSDEIEIKTPEKRVVIEVHGDIHSNDAERLLGDLRTLITENDEVLIDSGSRNGQEIAAIGGGI